ncbi:potassium channel family protein [Halarsenatibacter silvermanii]|uniref:Trk system potassium uptake protein TrkA n=1 Tax=Halarsenatibacter silvermanii TaxID=321763 RepID=A0A1G9PT76_9FIRM|nr:NAD-binding protein [Halarsenatibacter silvermanii]SDM01950.1 trk system potassium uptake protein TrkA [Halarsenatibacter silvermanii]
MKIVIAGGHKTGQKLMKFFQQNNEHEIVLIDEDAEVCERVSEKYSNVKIVWGDATYPSNLEEAGVADSDVFIAVTSSDHANLLAAKAAKKMGLNRVIAKVNNHDYQELAELMDFDYILQPSDALSAEIITRLQGIDFVKMVENMYNEIQFNVTEVEEGSELIGTACESFSEKYTHDSVCPVLIIRKGKYNMANEIESIKAGDEIIYLSREEKSKIKQKLIKF